MPRRSANASLPLLTRLPLAWMPSYTLLPSGGLSLQRKRLSTRFERPARKMR